MAKYIIELEANEDSDGVIYSIVGLVNDMWETEAKILSVFEDDGSTLVSKGDIIYP